MNDQSIQEATFAEQKRQATTTYRALETGVAFFDRADRLRLVVGGPDRARFLHNLTTNDVKRLAVNQGQEAFVTSPQGKTLGFVTLLAGDDQIWLRSDLGSLAMLGPHLQKYGVFDEVTLDDSTARTFEFHLAGPRAVELLRLMGAALPEPRDLAHTASRLGEEIVRVVREAPTGRPGLTLIGDVRAASAITQRLFATGAELGLVEGDAATFEAARIEAGTPCSGRDVTAENLPQEVGRDARAINFIKGCYLGQETVARIDALGHVNKHLKGLKIALGPVPPQGATIEVAGKAVGTITSAADSPGYGHPVALGYLRTAHAVAGTEVQVRQGDATWSAVVSELPMVDQVPGVGNG
jgi:folate-binding protein YgfZ